MKTSGSEQQEGVHFTLQPAWKSYFVFYVAILIFGLGPSINPEAGISRSFGLVLSLFLLFFVVIRRKTTFYRITKEAVLRETGFSGQVTRKILSREEISRIEVRRGVIHRLIGIGHIQFCSKNPGQADLWWYGVADPFNVKESIQRLIK
jgi:uncharacterized membrane protein YdbT with pleckstrin-like domain